MCFIVFSLMACHERLLFLQQMHAVIRISISNILQGRCMQTFSAAQAKQLAQDLEGLREYIASLEAQLANIHGNDDRHKIVRKYNDLLDKYHDSEKVMPCSHADCMLYLTDFGSKVECKLRSRSMS